MSKSEEEFWNTSSHSGFNFDFEDDFSGASLDPIFQSLTEENSELPIHAVISKNSLECVLNNLNSTIQPLVSPVDDAIKNIIYGHKCNLHEYVKFHDKVKLLEQSLNSCDANVIIKIINFLKETLKVNVFYHQLSKRKIAVKHFGHYLMMKNGFEELADLYMATGNTSRMKQLYYLTGEGVTNKQVLHKKLEQFMIQHLQKLNSNEDKSELYDNLQLIQFQIDQQCCFNSVIQQLAELCKTEVVSQKGRDQLREFKKLFKIDDFTFEWTLLNILASKHLWTPLSDIFIKNNWLTTKVSLKISMSAEIFLNGLSRHNPPKAILEQYLSCISDTEKAVFLAQKFLCHSFVIQHFVNQRDRMALINYRDKLIAHTDEYILIESSLQSSEKKWKN